MGQNTTGQGDTNAYRLGRGKLYFASLLAGVPNNEGYRFLGNTTEFNVNSETEKLEHTSSQAGLKVVDKEVIVSQKMGLSLSLDEINHDNMTFFFSGSKASYANTPAKSGITVRELVTLVSGGVKQGRWYDITDASGNRAYNIAKANLVVGGDKAVAGTFQTLTEGTEYTVDEKMGRIFLVVGTFADIGDGTAIQITLTADATAAVVEEVQSLTQTAVTGSLKFIGINASTGKEEEFQFHQVSLKPEGDFALISEEFTTIQLTGSVEKNEAGGGTASPYVTVRDHVNS